MIAALGVGSVLAGRYELVRHIARGGMADVYEADDRQLQRAVAIKVFRAGATADRARFDAEVVVLAALNHPGLVQVYDAGEHEGDAFVVLDLVDGPTLAARLASGGPIPPPRPPRWAPRSPTPSPTCTTRGSCIETSRPPTCCAAPTAGLSWPTSGSPG